MSDVPADGGEVERDVPHVHRNVFLDQQDGVAGGIDDHAKHAECVAVAKAVGEEGGPYCYSGGKGVDWDGVELSFGRGPSQLFEDGRCEEGAGVTICSTAKVHDNPGAW